MSVAALEPCPLSLAVGSRIQWTRPRTGHRSHTQAYVCSVRLGDQLLQPSPSQRVGSISWNLLDRSRRGRGGGGVTVRVIPFLQERGSRIVADLQSGLFRSLITQHELVRFLPHEAIIGINEGCGYLPNIPHRLSNGLRMVLAEVHATGSPLHHHLTSLDLCSGTEQEGDLDLGISS